MEIINQVDINPSPRQPRPSSHGGALSVLLTLKRLWRSWEFLYPTDRPNEFYKGGGANGTIFTGLLPFQTAVKGHEPVSINVTATATAAQIKAGVIKSLSAAAVALTLPTAALLAAALDAREGTWFDFAVDNSAGANTVTVTASASITAATAVVTGGATLTVASGAVGLFRIYFSSITVAKIYRMG
jgi:plasmid maintenance system antidote protein VapI